MSHSTDNNQRHDASRVAKHLADVPRSGIRDFFEIVATRRDIISLGIGEPDFTAPWHVCEASVFALERGATSYTANLGLLELREAVSAYTLREHGVRYDPGNEILIAVGVSEALDLAIRAIVNPGDEVLYHDPGFVAYAPLITFAHGRPVAVTTRREDAFKLRRKDLEAKVTPRTRALLLNFPTNPTGAVMTAEDLAEVAAFAIEHDLVVISDEIYAELTFEGKHASIAALPGMRERTIYLNGFSKSWAMTGFRVGYACAPPDLTEAMMKIHQYCMMCAPVLSQKAAIEALRAEGSDVDDMRREYLRRRNFICAAFKDMGVDCSVPQGTFYAFPYIGNLGLSAKDFSLKFLDEHNVACVPGSAFGDSGEGFLRCAFATSLEDLREAMRRMAVFVTSLRR